MNDKNENKEFEDENEKSENKNNEFEKKLKYFKSIWFKNHSFQWIFLNKSHAVKNKHMQIHQLIIMLKASVHWIITATLIINKLLNFKRYLSFFINSDEDFYLLTLKLFSKLFS